MPYPSITYKRRFAQGALILVALLLPFASISGNPFLRMDITRMTLFLAGIPLRIDQFYLVLLLILVFVAMFLLVTAILGRVWCGWFCPQTVLNDLLELLSPRFKAKASPAIAALTEHLVALIIAKLVAFDLFCWFLPPRQVFSDLLNYSEHWPMLLTFLLLTLLGYLNLVLVKRSFCRSYCPYGRFQTALMDAGTLNLSFLEETRDLCLRCNSCVRACPMGIDIRAGFQIECIGCGRCVDRCRAVMESKPGGLGLIGYRFGTIKGGRFRPGSTTIALFWVTLLLSVVFAWSVLGRSQGAFALQRVATASTRYLADGSAVQPWRAIIGNRTETAQTYAIRISGSPSVDAELLGQVDDIKVAANQHREVIFMIHIAQNAHKPEKIVLQLQNGNRVIATMAVSP